MFSVPMTWCQLNIFIVDIFKQHMSGQFDFRALLIKVQDLLSDGDRVRLHFLLGDDIPRNLRDNPSLNGTLSVLESFFDKDKISEQDCDYLIEAFKKNSLLQRSKTTSRLISFFYASG